MRKGFSPKSEQINFMTDQDRFYMSYLKQDFLGT